MMSDNEIKDIVQYLEEKVLKPDSHLYKRFTGKTIGEATEVFSQEYADEAKKRPGLVLLSVVLAAHRNYTKQVEPQIERIRKLDFYSFQQLKEKAKDFDTFASFSGMRDREKYSIIVELLEVIDKLKKYSGIKDDYNVMEKWAIKADYRNYKEDIIGRIKGIGIATFQHLRMNFGANTIKPDQRVKEVLNKEFGFYAKSDIGYINAVEYIAKVIGKSALYIDQVFVNYGSGYYINKHYVDDRKVDTYINIEYKDKLNTVEKEKPEKKNSINDMVEYINNSVKDLDITIEKRNDGGYIIVANKLRYRKSGKNVATYWVTSSSVSVIILGVIPRTTFYILDEMERAEIAQKIRMKYYDMVC